MFDFSPSQAMIGIILAVGILLAVSVQISFHWRNQKKKYKKLEENLYENAVKLVQKIDIIEDKLSNGGGQMDADMKKVAKYLAAKIEEVKDELQANKDEVLGKLDEFIEELTEKEEPKEETKEEDKEDAEEELDELDDYEGDRSISFDDAMKELDDPKSKKKKKK